MYEAQRKVETHQLLIGQLHLFRLLFMRNRIIVAAYPSLLVDFNDSSHASSMAGGDIAFKRVPYRLVVLVVVLEIYTGACA